MKRCFFLKVPKCSQKIKKKKKKNDERLTKIKSQIIKLYVTQTEL